VLSGRDIPWPQRVRVVAIWLVAMVLATLALLVPLPFTGQVALKEGDVAGADVAAPRQISYVSEVLTEQRRELAASAVAQVYDPPQARIGRQQLTLARQLLDFIASVRSDQYADLATRLGYLKAISTWDVPPDLAGRLLALPPPAWERVSAESQAALERAMRGEIREDNLSEEQRRVSTMVRLDLSDEESGIVRSVVQSLIVPNTFYNQEKTDERRRAARDRVEPVLRSFERNEKILRAGDIVTALDGEALDA
jgi:membrane-associated HD superfamily phosphohydrolase